MAFTVTLKDLRDADACVEGYNKLVCSLKGVDFDESKETHIRCAHKEPINIAYIAESNGIDDALWALRCVKGHDRDFRLYAVWCARQVQHLMEDQRSLNALNVSERNANGLATDTELDAARDAARDDAWDAAMDAARDAARADARDAAWDAAWDAARDAQKEMLILS